MRYMLAVEPHQGQAALLRDVVSAQIRTTLTVVDSMDAAMAAIGDEVPSLIFVSPLLPPQEEKNLVAHLRTLPEAACTQILITPWMSAPDLDRPWRPWSNPFRRPRWRPAGCDPSVLADQVAVYLNHVHLKTLEHRASLSRCENLQATERVGADRRSAVRFENLDGATALIDGAAVSMVDLSATGAQVLSPTLLQLGGLIQIVLSVKEEAIRCEAAIVWSAFDLLRPTQTPGYRAGMDFKGAGRGAIEQLCSGRDWKRSAVETPATRQMAVRDPRNETAGEFLAATWSGEGRPIHQRRACERHRAERRMAGDVPWLSTIKLPWGLEVRLLNISSTGILIETGSKFTPGIVTELRLCAAESELVISACFVRSEVASVDGRGVKYHAAATFEKQLDLDKLAGTGFHCVHCGHRAAPDAQGDPPLNGRASSP